jgi:hypothetical protein
MSSSSPLKSKGTGPGIAAALRSTRQSQKRNAAVTESAAEDNPEQSVVGRTRRKLDNRNKQQNLPEFERSISDPADCMKRILLEPSLDLFPSFVKMFEHARREYDEAAPRKSKPLDPKFWFWFSAQESESPVPSPDLVQMKKILLYAQNEIAKQPSPLLFYNLNPCIETGLALKDINQEQRKVFLQNERIAGCEEAEEIFEKRNSLISKKLELVKHLKQISEKTKKRVTALTRESHHKELDPDKLREMNLDLKKNLMKTLNRLLQDELIKSPGKKFIIDLSESGKFNERLFNMIDVQSLGFLINHARIIRRRNIDGKFLYTVNDLHDR